MTWREVLPSVKRLSEFQKWLKLPNRERVRFSLRVPVSRDERKVLEFLDERWRSEAEVGGFLIRATQRESNICCPGHGKQMVIEVRVTSPDPRQGKLPFYRSDSKVIPFRRREP